MDLIIRNARAFGHAPDEVDIGIAAGRIAALQPRLDAEGPSIDAGGRLVSAGLVETHIHLDKTRIIDSCIVKDGTVQEALAQTASAKRGFTEADIYARAR